MKPVLYQSSAKRRGGYHGSGARGAKFEGALVCSWVRSWKAGKTLGGIGDRHFRPIRELLPAVAGDIMLKTQIVEFRLFPAADVDGEGAACLEFAARRRVDRRGDLTFQLLHISRSSGLSDGIADSNALV